MDEPDPSPPAPLLPHALRRGDVIGLCSPSMPHAARFPRRRTRAIGALEAAGYRVREGRNWLKDTGHTAGTPEERVQDLHELFADGEVRAIMTSIGGYNANQLLELLDYDLIRRHPKLLIGYSDATALLLAIWKRARVGVVMGPQLLPQWGESGGCLSYTEAMLERTVADSRPIGDIPFPEEQVLEFLAWDCDDERPRRQDRAAPVRVLREGEAEGFLIGANLDTLLRLAGTDFWPDLRGAMLLVETAGSDVGEVEAQLTHLRHLGVFDQIVALGLGRFTDPAMDRLPELAAVVDRAARGFRGPVLSGLPLGHTDPVMCVPFGARAVLHAGERQRLTVLDPAVREDGCMP
ncbi:S66 peptidase family protein [Nonomuraea sp. NPDC049607]|uniref:S66 peptidase family protein n=1 Tax=Nonomuraea sp. NPDC049607 TaxID=3154732 RepID=UPI00343AFD5A